MVTETIEFINPDGLHNPSPFGYTQVTVVPPTSTLIYVSGQYGADENGNLVSDDFATQLKQSFANLRTALTAAGARLEDVVKITLFSVEHNAEKQRLISLERNATWGDRKPPASTLVPVPRLALDGMLFEIEAVAVVRANLSSSTLS